MAKILGLAQFADDAAPSDALVTAILRASRAGERVRVDVAAARQAPGVAAALGPADVAGVVFCTNPHGDDHDTRALTDRPRYVGEAIAAVAADTAEHAEQALRLIRVDHVAMDDALGPPVVVERGSTAGEIEVAWRNCAQRFESSYRVGGAPHGFIERPAAAAQWSPDGRCDIWSSTQSPHAVRSALARALGLSADAVVMHPVFVGGGFGGKDDLGVEPLAALLSQAADGRPVRITLNRAITTAAHRRRHPMSITVRTGFDSDGGLAVRWLEADLDAGADVGHSIEVARNGLALATAIYPAAAMRFQGVVRHSASPPATGFRGYGGTEMLFAVETAMNEIAAAYDIDPIQFRLRYCARAGQRNYLADNGFRLQSCLEAVPPRPVLSNRSGGRIRRGWGVAALVDTSSAVLDPGEVEAVTARCSLTGGRFEVGVATVEMGTGNFSAFASEAAAVLGVPAGRVDVVGDMTGAASDRGAFGSRSVHVAVPAVREAARRLREELMETVADRNGSSVARFGPEGLTLADGRELPFEGLGAHCAAGIHVTTESGLVGGVQCAQVTVDTYTGEVTVEHITSIHDVGILLDPAGAAGQVSGGVVQGIGWTLFETDPVDADGQPTASGFLEHLLPTVDDVPVIETIFVEGAQGVSAKGLGEAPYMAVGPAVVAAIKDATGVWLRDLPATPERVLEALSRSENNYLTTEHDEVGVMT